MFSDTRIIFGDLTDCLHELNNCKDTPVKVRREFARFISLTQQLTEVMRKEYKAKTQINWEASIFDGWNKTTELFKKLRRTDYHESPVIINVKEKQYYLAAILEDENGKEHKGYFVASVLWGLGDPFSTKMPGDMKLLMYDENMNQIEDEGPEFSEYEYVLHSRTDEIEKAIQNAGQEDIYILCNECYAVMKKYYDFYTKQLQINTKRIQ